MKENNRVLSLLLCIVMVVGMLSAFCLPAMADIPSVGLDEEVVVSVSGQDESLMYSFTAPESGIYNFYSYDNELDLNGSDPYIDLYSDPEMENSLGWSDDHDGNLNFSVNQYIEQGETVYAVCSAYDSCTYNFKVIKAVSATSIEISGGDTFTGYVGFPRYFEYTLSPEHCIDERIDWTSSNPDVVEFVDLNMAEFNSLGTSTITATSANGLVDTATVTVKEPEIYEFGDIVSLNENDYVVYKFVPTEDGYYTRRCNSDYGYCDCYVYDNSANYIDYLNGCYLEAGKTYYLEVKVHEDDADFYVEKLQKATSVEIYEGDTYTGYVGASRNFDYRLNPYDSMYESAEWTSSNTDVVDFNGYTAYFKSVGTATLTVTTENGLTDSIVITVKEPDTIFAGQSKIISFDESLEPVTFKLVPDTTKMYHFYAESEDEVDSRIDAYEVVQPDSSDEYPYNVWIGGDDDGDNSSCNFNYYERLEAGKTYYITVDARDEGDVTVYCETVVGATDFTLSIPEKAYFGSSYSANVTSVPDGAAISHLWVRAEDEEVVNCIQSSGSNLVIFDFNRVGSTTVYASAEGVDGEIEKNYNVEVVEPEFADLSQETELPAVYNEEIYGNTVKFTVPEDKLYAFMFSSDYAELCIYDSQYENIMSVYCEGEWEENIYLLADKTYYLSYAGGNALTVQYAEAVMPESIIFEKTDVTIYETGEICLEYTLLPEDSVITELEFDCPDMGLYVSGYGTDGDARFIWVEGKNAAFTAPLTVTVPDTDTKAVINFTVIPAEVVTEGVKKTLDFTKTDNNESVFSFVPETDGYYTFKFEGEDNGSIDVYDEDDYYLYSTGDDIFSVYLLAGKTYYCSVYGENEAFVTVSKSVEPTAIKFEYDSIPDAFVGEEFDLNYYFEPYNGYSEEVTFTSSNENVVKVYDDGHVEIKAHGKAVITATLANGASDSIEITAVDNTIQAGKIYTISKESSFLYKQFSFTPSESGTYLFKSLASEDTDCEIWNEYEYYIFSDDYDPFIISAELEAGVEYCLSVYYLGDAPCEHSFFVKKQSEGECEHYNVTLNKEKPSTCKENGHAEYIYCNDCEKVIIGSDAELPKNHSFGEYVYNNDATVEKDGTKTRTCSVCGEKETVIVAGTKVPMPKPDPVPEQKPVEIVDTTKVFTDVKAKKWYTNAVNYAYSHGFIAGVSDNEFGRDVPVTRGMFITILARIAGVDTSSKANKVQTKFTDVKSGKYYTNAIKWASDNGIVSGLTDTTFGPNAAIERQQLCTMIINFAKYMKIELPETQKAIEFKDASSIRKYAKNAVTTCQKAGIVSGYLVDGGTEFRPLNTATRAEAAQILYKFHKDYVVK